MVNDKIDVGLRLGLDEKSKASVKSQVDKLKKEFETLKKESIQLSSKELDLQKKMLVNEGLRLKNQRLQISVEKEKAKVSQNASKSELDLANRKLKEQKQMLVNDGIAVKNKQKILAVEKKETLEIEKQNKASITKLAKEEKSLQNQKVSLAIFKEQQARSVTGLETGTLKGTYNTAELDKFKASVDALKTTTPDLNNQMRTLKSQFKNIETNARTSSRAIKEAADNTVTLGSQLKNAFGKFILWMGVTTVFFGVVRALRSGIDTVIELDTALVELKKVTDETETSYNKFLKTSIDVSKSLGRTTVETLNATSAFARMGYTINESLELAKSSLTLLNVADDIETVDEATNSLITALKGFQLEADMSVKIVDSLNNVSNKFAVTTGDLSEGVRRTSATMNSAGNSFDQLNGMLVGANEGMKNIEKSSSGLNTISMRLRGVGEDTEGLVPKLKEAFDQIGESGVAIEDSAGNLRSTYDILNDLAGSYDTISSKQQQYVAELAAGKKQAAVFYNLMSNWDNVVKATAASIDSVGSATKEQEKVLESVQGRLNILSSTADEFWVSFISSDLLKGGISGLTELLNILNKILDTFGGMGVILPILIGTIAIFKKTILVGLIAQLQYIPVVLSYIIAGITGVTVSLGVATALLSGLTLVLGAAFLAWKSNNKAQEEAIDNLNQLEDGLKGANEQFTKTSEMIDAFEELSNKINKTAVETAEMNSLQGKLNEIMPEVKNKIDGQNISLDEQIELYKELNNAIKEKAINEAQDILDRFSGTYDERATKIEENEAALREYNASLANQREQLRLLQEKYPKSTAMINIQRNAIDNTKDSMDKLNEETEDLININRNLANAEDLVAQSKSEIIQSSDLLISSYEDEMGIIGDLADKNEEQLGKMLKDEKELTEGLRQEITKRLLMRRAEFDPTTITVAGGIEVQTHGFSGSDDPVIKGLKDRLDTINKIYAENTIKISNQILGLGGDASTSTSDNTKYLSEQQQALNKVNSELSLLENNYKTIENGSDKLVAKYKEQQDALHNLADLLRVQLTLLDPTTQEYADLQNTIDGLSNSWWSAEKSISDFNKELEDEALKKAEEALKRANEALKDYKENLEDLAKTYQDDFSRGIDKGIARLEELRDLEDDSIQSSIDGIESKIESMEEAN
ncbi:MAG: phage tail tape measure protein, partial [Bacteroidetes bacterium 4572_112]